MTTTMMAMGDGAQLRTWTEGSAVAGQLPVVMVHGGPGIPDYLAPVAEIIDDLCLVHRYDQRGVGGSSWKGEHTISRHIEDLASVLDVWGHDRVVLAGHSFGTNLACYFLLAHPERVAGLILLAGPFLDPWREADQATQRERRSDQQQARLEELDAIESRTGPEETEFLALSSFTDHADRTRAWHWAIESAHMRRPLNYIMNRQVNAAKNADPLDYHMDELSGYLPPGAVIIGGAGDSRPAAALQRFGARIDCEVVIIPDSGHEPWREAPTLFAEAFRAAVKPQTQPAGSGPAGSSGGT